MTAVELPVIDHPSSRLRVMNHPAASRHPSAEGNLDRDGTGVVASSVVKGNLNHPAASRHPSAR